MNSRKFRKFKTQFIGWTIIVLIIAIVALVVFGIVSFTKNIITGSAIPAFSRNDKTVYNLPAPYPVPAEYEEYTGRVEHIFFHPLIAYPELTFDYDYQSKGFDDWFVTVDEFNKIINSLYEKDFILVSPYEMFEYKDGSFARKNPMLPKGKKPIIISLDDMNYYEYMQENGTIHRLIFDSNNNVAAYTKRPDGTEIITRDNCIIPLLDDFVSKHPDFSHNGAKGCIGLTGFEGVLGYRTHKDSPTRQEEIDKVLPIIKRLKDSGWTFASHSYAHRDTAQMSYDSLAEDCEKWKNEVQSLIGDTEIYLYPYGSGVKRDDPKYDLLVSYGFRSLCAVGIESYVEYSDTALAMDRRHVDGIALRHQRELNLDLYDANEIIDSIRPAEYQNAE